MASVLIVGCGNMGKSLIDGILSSSLEGVSVSVFDIHPEKLRKYVDTDIEVLSDKPQQKNFDAIILCIKPADLEEVSGWLKNCLTKESVLVTILAGVEIQRLSNLFSKISIVRAMPNICATVGEAATALSCCSNVTPIQRQLVVDLFETIGLVQIVGEGLLDAVTGLSGSGPAYIFMIIEALIDGGVKMGMPRQMATNLVLQTVKGSVEVVRETREHPAVLKDRVTTPAGTTIHAIHELETQGLRSMLINAVGVATEKSKSLGGKGRKRTKP